MEQPCPGISWAKAISKFGTLRPLREWSASLFKSRMLTVYICQPESQPRHAISGSSSSSSSSSSSDVYSTGEEKTPPSPPPSPAGHSLCQCTDASLAEHVSVHSSHIVYCVFLPGLQVIYTPSRYTAQAGTASSLFPKYTPLFPYRTLRGVYPLFSSNPSFLAIK
jgi:hypothetical protein